MRILLHADEGKTNDEVSEVLHTGTSTVQRTRLRFIKEKWKERPTNGHVQLDRIDAQGKALLETLSHSRSSAGQRH
ncbi:MAG: hypothetical protein ACLFV5_05705 [Anaerolineales bacterium]